MEERFEVLRIGIGPRDAGSGDVGGNTMYGRVEILSSLGLDAIPECAGQYSAISAHFGVNYPTNEPAEAKDVRASLGFGIYWATAIGPLSFSWANPISK